jgi:hypothetical protein
MGRQQKLLHELKAIGLAALFFGGWIAVFIAIKQLVLAEYRIEFYGFSKALVGALILSKVVVVLEHVPLGAWVRARPAWVDVLLRTILYAFGVLLVLLLEKGFEGRHEYGGIAASLRVVYAHTDINHVWSNALVLTGALLTYNVLSVIRSHLGKGGMLRLFLTPVPQGTVGKQ